MTSINIDKCVCMFFFTFVFLKLFFLLLHYVLIFHDLNFHDVIDSASIHFLNKTYNCYILAICLRETQREKSGKI